MASTYDVANDLRQYGEDAVATWVEACTDDEFVRVCNAADFVLFHGPSSPSGASMMLAKACAIGAVYVCEGAPRNLARSRRDTKRVTPTRSRDGDRRTDYWLQHSFDQFYGVGDDFVDFWAESPAKAHEFLVKARANTHFNQSAASRHGAALG